MSGGQAMVVLIVLIAVIGSVLRARYSGGRGHRGIAAGNDAETQRLREEVKVLKERLHVLERITVEKENSLEREIERLRDH